MNAKLILIGLAGMLTLASVGPVNGQEWAGSQSSSAGWGFGWPTGYYGGEALPYFSLYPPVYYSYRVPRPYGYSPFAYPSGVLTPSSSPPRAAAGQNQYTMAEGGYPAAGQQGRPPLRINNPFVEQPGSPGAATNQRPPARQPKVVYPAALARRGSDPVRGS